MLTRNQFEALLGERGALVIDGALATELENRGHNLNHALWSAKVLKDNPDSISEVHKDYYLAGADIAITASYQASTRGLHDHFHMNEADAIKLIKDSVKVAQQARDDAYLQGVASERKLLVAGSVGPYGAYLADGSEYRGNYHRTKTEFQTFHRPRIQALVDANVDLLAIETMPKLAEITAVLELLRYEFPMAVAWLSCTLRNSRHISDGTSVKDLLKHVGNYRDQVVAVGVNCVPNGLILETLQWMKEYTTLPLLCYPNSGEAWNAETKTWSGVTAQSGPLAQQIRSWRTTGARLIGGCCRTGPDYIKVVSRAIR